MKRFLSCLLMTATTLFTVAEMSPAQSFPVVHEQSMVVRVRDGLADRPIAHAHVLLVAGYDHRDLQRQFFREEVLTDGQGQISLSRGFLDLPWLQVWIADGKLCQAKFRSEDFSVERVRADGYSAPNRCGTVIGKNEPGRLTVFAVMKGQKHLKHKKTLCGRATDVKEAR